MAVMLLATKMLVYTFTVDTAAGAAVKNSLQKEWCFQ